MLAKNNAKKESEKDTSLALTSSKHVERGLVRHKMFKVEEKAITVSP